jgi:NSS family neurotransmitter:Na+ symporter
MRKSDDIPKMAFTIGFMIIVTALLCGLMIFPIIFTFGFSPEEGRGLVFKTLPVLFSKLPGSLFISLTFFILFVFAALTSAMAFVEVISANLTDLLGWSRRKSVFSVGLACFLIGIPSALSYSDMLFSHWNDIFGKTFFATVDDLVSIWLLPLGALMVSLYAGWFFNRQLSQDEFSAGTRYQWAWSLWLFFVRWVAPIAIVLIMLQESGIINVDALVGIKFGTRAG